jgi:hypothetical protein
LYAVSSRDLRPTLPNSCPPEILTFLNVCWNKTPEERPDFPTVLQQLRDLQVIFHERKAAWDAAIGASWLANEENAQKDETTAQTENTTSQSTAPTQAPTPGNSNFSIARSVSSSHVNNEPAIETISGTTTRSRRVSDAGRQSVVTAEFSFKREKSSSIQS